MTPTIITSLGTALIEFERGELTVYSALDARQFDRYQISKYPPSQEQRKRFLARYGETFYRVLERVAIELATELGIGTQSALMAYPHIWRITDTSGAHLYLNIAEAQIIRQA